MLNPILNNKKYLVNYAIVWVIIIMAHFAILHFYYNLNAIVALADSALFNVFFAFLGINLWYVVRYSNSESNFLVKFLSHVLSSLLMIGFWLISGYLILKYAIDEEHYHSFLENAFPWRIVSGIFYYSVFILVYYVVVFYQDNQKKIKEEEKLKRLIKEVELSALKHQINPHFLFNSLNSVSSLTISSPQKAQEMIIKLSEYLRYSLSKEDQQLTDLATEINNIKLYLEIEKIRFGDRLDLRFDCDRKVQGAKVPTMILQPLFENAIKHGVYESTETIIVSLSCYYEGEVLTVSLENNFDQEAKKVKGEGVGLRNTQQRMFLLYKKKELFSVEKSDNKFKVTIKFPQNG